MSARIKSNSLGFYSFTYSSSVWISLESTLISSVTSSSDEISSSYQPSSESGIRLESSDPSSFFEYARMNPRWMESREILFTASWNLFLRSLSPRGRPSCRSNRFNSEWYKASCALKSKVWVGWISGIRLNFPPPSNRFFRKIRGGGSYPSWTFL